MRLAYCVILISSFLLLSACGSSCYVCSNNHRSFLPSLDKAQPRQIVQVEADSDKTSKHEAPYFIVCLGDECPALTPKTHLQSMALSNKKSPSKTTRRSESYFKKTTATLEQYRVHFEYASAVIPESYKTLLKTFVNDYPHQKTTLRVTGFTDNGKKVDGTIGNEWLALERALSVKKTLIALGYPETQILLEAKFLCCYIDSNKKEAGRSKNRRAEITLINH